MDPNLRLLVRLNLTRRVAERGRRRLLEGFGSLERAFAAPEEKVAALRGIGPKTARAMKETTDGQAEDEIARAAAAGARIVSIAGEAYPERLRDTDDAPLVLYVRGDLGGSEAAVAVVGARRATPYGARTAGRIARGLAEAAVTVVSGLARGIDAWGHRGAIEAGGRTVAVLGSGLDRPYPAEHAPLADQIVETGGAVVSEFPFGAAPLAFHFPRRNRIVSGLSLGVVIVEAAEKSGSLITAEWALEQSRDVMAVPGRVDDRNSAGCHRLIQDGATLVLDAGDVLAALRLDGGAGGERRRARAAYDPEETPADLSPEETQVYALIGAEPCHVDDLIDGSGLPASTVFKAISGLELRRVVHTWPGRLYQRV